ncbi:carbohydrate ABC transporter permease [Paenibacillaceae bacterium WGS1546]|uniref:carbohydrate ABC transporter permease n=1 Tax=Cohnella sp. WGS1546 TaxID=3366810 RepID=UPI00372D7C88
MFLHRKYIWTYVAFLVPALLVFTIVRIVPLILSFRYSFTNWNGFSQSYNFVGFQNYISLFNDAAIVQSIRNTAVFGIVNPLLVTLFAIPIALVLNMAIPFRSLQRVSFFFPSVPSVLIIGYLWLFIFDPTDSGVLNRILHFFGMDPVAWLAGPNMAMGSLIAVSVWKSAGWHACIYLANLQMISKDYYEAAMIDGANVWQKFRYITFPLLAPAVSISVTLILIDSLKIFELPFALTKGGPGYSTTLLTQIIIETGVFDRMIGKASALSIVFVLMILVVAILQLTLLKRREDKIQ